MALLHVALQEGFASDRVTVRVGGREVFRKSAVSTRLQIGLADSFEVDVPPGTVLVEVDVPSKGTSLSTEVQITDVAYLGVSVSRQGQLEHTRSAQPFGYL